MVKIYWRITNIVLVNDAIHERINKGREDSHANTPSWTSFMIVNPHQLLYVKKFDVGQGIQRNDLCLFLST